MECSIDLGVPWLPTYLVLQNNRHRLHRAGFGSHVNVAQNRKIQQSTRRETCLNFASLVIKQFIIKKTQLID